MTKRKYFICILGLIFIIASVVVFCFIREDKLRRAAISTEILVFDGMEFVRCTDYAFIDSLEPAEIICKTTDGEWRIFSVENYEDDYEYVYARLTFDGYFYERIK